MTFLKCIGVKTTKTNYIYIDGFDLRVRPPKVDLWSPAVIPCPIQYFKILSIQ
jgi:hypothetical protein